MQTITSTHLARHLREVLDQVEFRHDSVTVVRNKKPIARIVPGARHITALPFNIGSDQAILLKYN